MKHRYFMVKDKEFLSVGGQGHNSSSMNREDLIHTCQAVVTLGGNTVALPVSWESFEPEEGCFRPLIISNVIDTVRSFGLHLVILWFGTWKNGTMEYVPQWIKLDKERFPRTLYANGEYTSVLSCHSDINREAEATAFREFMKVIKECDEETQTVIGVQVDNETGIFAPVQRDFSDQGNSAFYSNVPVEIINYGQAHPESKLNKCWKVCGEHTDTTWEQTFGDQAAESCAAWHTAKYIDYVAAAGKAVYDIPFTVNVWLQDGPWGIAGLEYPCGGPMYLSTALDIWRAACKSIDFIAPDNYSECFDTYRSVCDAYEKSSEGWPLFTAESSNLVPNANYMFYAIGEKKAVGHHVFAIEDLVDDNGIPKPRAKAFINSFSMIRNVSELIMKYRGTSDMLVFLESPGYRFRHCRFDQWMCSMIAGGPDFAWNAMDFRHLDDAEREFDKRYDIREEMGRAFIFRTGENEFLMAGHQVRVFFHPAISGSGLLPYSLLNSTHQASSMETLSVEEGMMRDTKFTPLRVRTGDEARHGIWLTSDIGVVRVRLCPPEARAYDQP